MQIGDKTAVIKIDRNGRMTKIEGIVTGLSESLFNPDAYRFQISEVPMWLESAEWVEINV
jgi:hypothetical protein